MLKLVLIRIDIHIYLRTVTRIHLEDHPHTDIYVPNHTQTQTCIQIYTMGDPELALMSSVKTHNVPYRNCVKTCL